MNGSRDLLASHQNTGSFLDAGLPRLEQAPTFTRANVLGLTRSSSSSARAAWAKCIERETPGLGAKSR